MCSEPGMPGERRADPDGDDRADEVLALAADVEQAAAERERDGEAGEDQRSSVISVCWRLIAAIVDVVAFHGNQTWRP